jgi:hypothetical protein
MLMISTLQSWGVRNLLLEHGFGGTFTGAWLSESGLSWMPDTTFIIYPPLSGRLVATSSPAALPPGPLPHVAELGVEIVRCFLRDNQLVVTSTLLPVSKVLSNDLNARVVDEEWMRRVEQELATSVGSECARFYVFIGKRDDNWSLVDAEATKGTVVREVDGRLAISAPLMRCLEWRPAAAGDVQRAIFTEPAPTIGPT